MQSNHPPKAQVRKYMQKRAREKSPPPTPEQVRRELGWGLIPGSGKAQEGDK